MCWTFLGIELHCEHYRWPNATVPYTFANDWDDPAIVGDENAAMRTTILAAMDEIEAVSAVRFVARTGQDDYVRFRDGSGCSATVGHQGGDQNVNLNVACNHTWIVTHEILHALGFNHEQSRDDRGGFVQINWANIIDDKEHNFEIADYSWDLGGYDFDSVMHYGAIDFCRRTRPEAAASARRSHDPGRHRDRAAHPPLDDRHRGRQPHLPGRAADDRHHRPVPRDQLQPPGDERLLRRPTSSTPRTAT